MLLVDDARHPTIAIGWPQRSGKSMELTMDRPYTAPEQRGVMGHNLECFVALGGTRLDAGAGNPAGAIVRVGFYKERNVRPFFEDLAPDSEIHIRLTGVQFNQPIVTVPDTILQHVKYMPEDLAACGLGGESINLYNTASLTDTLHGIITEDTARMGIINRPPTPDPAAHPVDDRRPDPAAKVETRIEADGSLTIEARIPYALLRHIKDPWVRTAPGSFQEPTHFHLELEVLPADFQAPAPVGE